MKMKTCIVVACNLFKENSHRHFITILFEMENGQVVQWNNPSLEVVEMMLCHSRTSIVYEHCNL